jgi:hypothetical protein
MRQLADALRPARGTGAEWDRPRGCDELLAGRSRLPEMWRAVVERRSVYEELRLDLRRMREELRDDERWGAGAWRENAALIAQGLNTAARLTRNAVSFLPSADVAATTTGLAQERMERADFWIQHLRLGDRILTLFADEAEKLLFDLIARLYAGESVMGKLVRTTVELADDLTKLRTIPENFSEMREELAASIARIERLMRENEERLLAHERAAAMIRALQSAIQMHCEASAGAKAGLP